MTPNSSHRLLLVGTDYGRGEGGAEGVSEFNVNISIINVVTCSFFLFVIIYSGANVEAKINLQVFDGKPPASNELALSCLEWNTSYFLLHRHITSMSRSINLQTFSTCAVCRAEEFKLMTRYQRIQYLLTQRLQHGHYKFIFITQSIAETLGMRIFWHTTLPHTHKYQ